MKWILKAGVISVAIALALPTSLMAKNITTMDDAREELARGVATLATDPAFDSALREHLARGKASLGDVLGEVQTAASADTVSHLRDLERKAIDLRGLTGALDALIDVRVHGVADNAPLPSADDLWIGTVSRDPVSGARQVVAFDAVGAEHRYDLEAMPTVPMLIIESDSSAAVHAGTTVMNEILRQGGVQSAHRPAGSALQAASGSGDSDSKAEQLTLIKRIYLAKDHEPDIQGDAEIFAIVSGVGRDGKPQLITKDMPWLDHDKHWYTPGMDLINWTDYGTNYVNVQLFEEDGNTDFKALAESVLKAVGDLSLLVAPEAPPALIVTGVTKIADEILKAMPGEWFQNANDYVDSFYVIERGGNYGTEQEPLMGARGEARMVLAPHEVKNR